MIDREHIVGGMVALERFLALARADLAVGRKRPVRALLEELELSDNEVGALIGVARAMAEAVGTEYLRPSKKEVPS